MNVAEAIDLIGIREMARRAGVSKATVDRSKKANRFSHTIAGRKMKSVCSAEGLEIGGGETAGQGDLPIQDPIALQIKKAELAKKEADLSEKERKNAEAEGRLLPAADVASRVGHAGAQLRTGLDGVRREIEAQLPDDCRDAILATFDAGVGLTVGAVTKAWEGG